MKEILLWKLCLEKHLDSDRGYLEKKPYILNNKDFSLNLLTTL